MTLIVLLPGKYHDLELQLIQEFTNAQRKNEISRMHEVAAVLLHFKVFKDFLPVSALLNLLCQRIKL